MSRNCLAKGLVISRMESCQKLGCHELCRAGTKLSRNCVVPGTRLCHETFLRPVLSCVTNMCRAVTEVL